IPVRPVRTAAEAGPGRSGPAVVPGPASRRPLPPAARQFLVHQPPPLLLGHGGPAADLADAAMAAHAQPVRVEQAHPDARAGKRARRVVHPVDRNRSGRETQKRRQGAGAVRGWRQRGREAAGATAVRAAGDGPAARRRYLTLTSLTSNTTAWLTMRPARMSVP